MMTWLDKLKCFNQEKNIFQLVIHNVFSLSHVELDLLDLS